ncbi:MAG TPA: hypothetical protein VNO70_04725 [Blastocatellia bacterium]|nr:hypothetical protein [Blastocatellia bacterium]
MLNNEQSVAVDYQSESLRLSLADIERLREGGSVSISPASPFGFLLHRDAQTGKVKQQADGKFFEPGIESEAGKTFARSGHQGGLSLFDKSLEILSRPDARLRVSSISPNEPPTMITIFMMGEHAACGFFDTDYFHVGAPVNAVHLVNSLACSLQGQAPPGGNEISLFPSEIQLGSLLWRANGKRASGPISREEVDHMLKKAGVNEEEVHGVLAGLLQADLIRSLGDSFVLNPRYQYWLDLIWSGYMFEIEHMALAGMSASEVKSPEPRIKRLLFVGPPGRRVLYQMVNTAYLTDELSQSEAGDVEVPFEEDMVFLTYLPREVLDRAIADFLEMRLE